MNKRITSVLLTVVLGVLGMLITQILGLNATNYYHYVEAATNDIVITEQPHDVTAKDSIIQTFQVSAIGSDLTYQWYRKLVTDSDWTVWKGKTSNNATFVAGSINYGMKVRCVITDSNGNSVTSDTAALTASITISSISVKAESSNGRTFLGNGSLSETGKSGDSLCMKVNAAGNSLTYQWYYKDFGGNWTVWAGETSYIVNTVIQKGWNERQFKCVIVNSSGSAESGIITLAVSDSVSANAREISLYAINENYSSYLSIPSDYLQSYSLPSSSYSSILYGDSVAITGNKVTPKATTWYYHQSETASVGVGSMTPTGAADEYAVIQYTFDDTAIKLSSGDIIVFHVIDYASYYATNIVDQYLNKNIKSSMTAYEKAEMCCKFVASYDYGTNASHYVGMVLSGSGDCWASTNALLYMLAQLGIACDSRYAGNDVGAGSGHYNVIAVLDGIYYILDAGYNGTAPRTYSITEYGSMFVYTKLTDTTISITGCLDLEGITVFNIPSQIDGYTVTEIGDRAFASLGTVESITIPNTVTSIGKKAFADNDALKSVTIPNSVISIGIDCFCFDSYLQQINIPASVESIGSGSFLYCSSLTSITVDSANKCYCSRDGVLFNKDCSILVFYPEARPGTSYEVPSAVKTIDDWAFAQIRNSDIRLSELKKLILPDALEHIGERAFYGIYLTELILPDSITSIPAYSFCGTGIREVVLPAALTEIKEYAFYSSSISVIDFPDSLVSIGDYAFTSCDVLRRTYIPASVKSIGDYAFYLYYGVNSMGSSLTISNYIWIDKNCNADIGTGAFNSIVVGVTIDSVGYQYAINNSVTYILLNNDQKIPLDSNWFSYTSRNYTYTRKAIMPSVSTVNDNMPFYLYEGIDYYFSYSDNVKPGTATISVNGLLAFDNNLSYKFTIMGSNNSDSTDVSSANTKKIKNGKVYDVDGISYKYNNNKLTVMKQSNGRFATIIEIPNKVSIYGKQYPVTAIESKAFYKKGLAQIVIGSNIKKIGKKAFAGNDMLWKITIKSKNLNSRNVGKKAFYGVGGNAIPNKITVIAPKKLKTKYVKILRKNGLKGKIK